MVNAGFTLDGVASAVVGRRAQTTLNTFAEANVFLLHVIAVVAPANGGSRKSGSRLPHSKLKLARFLARPALDHDF